MTDPDADGTTARDLPAWLAGLLRPEAYPHPVAAPVQLIETHISWVLLTGTWVYKIKRPVDLGFVDYSTLALRKQACEDELRLNRRFAPTLYDTVVPVCGTPDAPCIEGGGVVRDYAVRMRQFAQSAQLDRLLVAGGLCDADVDRLGAAVVAMHAQAPRATEEMPYGHPAGIVRTAMDNLTMLRTIEDAELQQAVSALTDWTQAQSKLLRERMRKRLIQGHVREVHGDLHLANLARIDKQIVPFDCIEFSAELRWNDTISDLAFLTMDLRQRGRDDLAYRLMQQVLDADGDAAALRLWRYYEVYRALVRAKIAAIRLRQTGSVDAMDELWRYLRLARRLTGPTQPALLLMHGVSGTGKSWLARQLVPALPALSIRADIERKRLHGLMATDRANAAPGAGLYGRKASMQTYARLTAMTREILRAGETVIVDATHQRAADRARFRRLAARLSVPFAILDCRAPQHVLLARLREREAQGRDASDADASVLAYQQAHADPLTSEDAADVIALETTDPKLVTQAVAAIRARCATAQA